MKWVRGIKTSWASFYFYFFNWNSILKGYSVQEHTHAHGLKGRRSQILKGPAGLGHQMILLKVSSWIFFSSVSQSELMHSTPFSPSENQIYFDCVFIHTSVCLYHLGNTNIPFLCWRMQTSYPFHKNPNKLSSQSWHKRLLGKNVK